MASPPLTAVVYVAESACPCIDCEHARRTGTAYRFPNCGKARKVDSYACEAVENEPHIPTRASEEYIRSQHPGTFLISLGFYCYGT